MLTQNGVSDNAEHVINFNPDTGLSFVNSDKCYTFNSVHFLPIAQLSIAI